MAEIYVQSNEQQVAIIAYCFLGYHSILLVYNKRATSS